MSRFASGVTVVTGILPDGRPAGVTASAFISVSLEPPLISICLDKATVCLEAFTLGSHFAIHILNEDQKDLSDQFARRSHDKFATVDYRIGERGVPILAGCLAVVECRREALHDAGDHFLIVGRVERLSTTDEGAPLLHFRGAYHRLAERL
jgi:flavin reductase (DIM6/NTAB) family NADH-FMN oxidoreductase RutF